MARTISLQNAIGIAVRHPENSAELLAHTLQRALPRSAATRRRMELHFCILFLGNMLDGHIEREIDPALVEKVASLSFAATLRLLKRTPEEGLQVLVAITMQELRKRRGDTLEQQVEFYGELLGRIFPDIDIPALPAEENGGRPGSVSD
jgi:hypothetical protein